MTVLALTVLARGTNPLEWHRPVQHHLLSEACLP